MAKKCPIPNDAFVKEAKDLNVQIGNRTVVARPHTFTTGSVGWRVNEKVPIQLTVNGVTYQVEVQVGMNATLVGSKPDTPPQK